MLRMKLFLGTALLASSLNVWSSDLVELYRETMASDPRISKAEAEAAIFQARERGSLGRLLPQAAAGAQGTRTVSESALASGSGSVRDYYYGERYFFSLSQSLYDKAKWEEFRGASKDSEQYIKRLEDTLGVVAVDLIEKYTKVLAAEDSYDFAVSERTTAQEQLKLVKARYNRKLAAITDYLSVEAKTDVLVSRELDAQNAVYIAREGLSELLGRSVDEDIASLQPGVVPSFETRALEDWISAGLKNSSSLQAQHLAVKAARLRVKSAAGLRQPTLGVTLSAQRSDIGYENSQVPPSETYVAALNVNVPLYSGGVVSSQIAEAQAKLRLAEQEYKQVDRSLRSNIRQSYLNTRSAQERVGATRKALQSAEKSYEAQQQGYKYGTVTVVDVLDASGGLYAALRDHRQALYDLMVASLMLQQTAGEFTPESIVTLNNWLSPAGQVN
jgi:outer membrane protein